MPILPLALALPVVLLFLMLAMERVENSLTDEEQERRSRR